ncbi:hypothetical protein HDU97_001957 [Phlyctochytrium planicorne]|nr:hypothetical protein HDU97_001957 [Phlyctochytrium planicorne]
MQTDDPITPATRHLQRRASTMADLQIRYRTLTFQHTFDREQERPNGKKQLKPLNSHLLRPEDVYVALSTDPRIGLDENTVKRKSAEGRLNVLSPPRSNYFYKFLGYTFGGFNALMWVACILSILSYQPLGGPGASPFSLGVGILILIVISISTFFYAYMDYNASKIMKSIQTLIANEATVIRNGQEQVIDAKNLLVGDLVVLTMGQRVPADLRLIEISSDLQFDRSLLTGESKPVSGAIEPSSENALETKNLALSSTFVVRGRGRGIVVQIGDDSVIGQILTMAGKRKQELTPIQRDLNQYTLVISSVSATFFLISMAVWGLWIRTSYPAYETLSLAIINSIGCLTVCFALSLAIIARRMAARSVVVKNLSSIETLGCMSVLCSDKTGTLTQGRMSVHSALFPDKNVLCSMPGSDAQIAEINEYPGLKELHKVATICNDASFLVGEETVAVADRKANGDATDTAILRFAESYRYLLPSLHDFSTLFTLAFNSKNKFSAKIVRKGAEPPLLLVKGAPDILFQACAFACLSTGSVSPIEKDLLFKISCVQENASSQGFRVLALCQKSLHGKSIPLDDPEALELFVLAEIRDLTLNGMLTLRDPPRSDALPTVKALRAAGVRVFMVTGDFELTAIAISKQVGIITCSHTYRISDLDSLRRETSKPTKRVPGDLRPKPADPIRSIAINGPELANITDSDWDFISTTFTEMIFARTSPEDKLRIVEALKKRGDSVVAVTGDGTNDAPAMRAADIGVAMGTGTDVAKEAASMILLKNDFASLLVGIENGRLVFENLRKVCLFLMPAGTYTEFMAVVSNVFFGMQIPLSSFLQVLFSVSTDIALSISIMYEKPEANLMIRPPRNARTQRLADFKFFIQIYLVIGPIIWISSMGMWFLYMNEQGLGFYDLMFAFDQWADGWAGKTLDELTGYVNVGQCIYFVCMAICQFGTILAIRNRSVSILESNPLWGPRQNLWIPAMMVVNIAICLIVTYGYWIQVIFFTSPIPAKFWFIPFASALLILMVDEIRKAIVRSFPGSTLAKLAW